MDMREFEHEGSFQQLAMIIGLARLTKIEPEALMEMMVDKKGTAEYMIDMLEAGLGKLKSLNQDKKPAKRKKK